MLNECKNIVSLLKMSYFADSLEYSFKKNLILEISYIFERLDFCFLSIRPVLSKLN